MVFTIVELMTTVHPGPNLCVKETFSEVHFGNVLVYHIVPLFDLFASSDYILPNTVFGILVTWISTVFV